MRDLRSLVKSVDDANWVDNRNVSAGAQTGTGEGWVSAKSQTVNDVITKKSESIDCCREYLIEK